MNKNKESLHLSSPAINTQMNKRGQIWAAFRSAFPYTIPIFAGFLFLGIAYGIFMHSLGFSAIYPIIMSFMIFAGSMEFVAANFLLGAFNPMNALFLTLMVNARHLFYGISMLDKYRGTGKKKLYLIFGMCDESFSINYTANVPANVDKGWFMFFVTLLNHLYWVAGAAIGGIFCDDCSVYCDIHRTMDEREKALQCSLRTWTFSSLSYPFWRKPIYYSCYARHFRGTDCSEKTIGES